jgi:DNA-binding Lrp family transcriptional regulator
MKLMNTLATPISILNILDAIRDRESQSLLHALATSVDDHNLANRLKITRKQFYTRIARLMKAGLVKRKYGRFNMTSFGSVIYEVQLKLSEAVDNYWKLKLIESIGGNPNNQFPQTERTRIIDESIHDPVLKEMVLALNKSA